MSEYDNSNSGALFKNKEKDESHPTWADYKGSINVDGTDYWLSAWLKKSKDGKPYMSLSVKPKNEDAEPVRKPQAAPEQDIPFMRRGRWE
jgi:hypothetical protein